MKEIIYVVHDSHESSNFTVEFDHAHDWWFLVLTHSKGLFLLNNETIELEENTLLIYPPNSKIYYRSCGDVLRTDWIRLLSDEQHPFGENVPLTTPIPIKHGDYCRTIISMLAIENYFDYLQKNSSIELLFQLLNNKIKESIMNLSFTSTPINLESLHEEIHNNPKYPWTVAHMADMLHLSPGHLQYLYNKEYQISCMEDVIQSRLKLSKYYLLHTNYSIRTISQLCGYNNLEHFSRQFKKFLQITPNEYRKIKMNLK